MVAMNLSRRGLLRFLAVGISASSSVPAAAVAATTSAQDLEFNDLSKFTVMNVESLNSLEETVGGMRLRGPVTRYRFGDRMKPKVQRA
ncbi:MAG: hypothetical protein ACRECF_07860 [Methyloceanibacter sp.]